MKTITLQHTTENKSQYERDLVWENAQDLEHVEYLHNKTNYAFTLMSYEIDPDKEYAYSSLVFMVKRKIFRILPITTFGYRKIKCKYEIIQLEYSPFLGLTSILHSTLVQDPENNAKTLLIDHVTMNIPIILRPLTWLIPKMLDRHTRIQSAEDESFRERRLELQQRNIKLPLSIFNKSLFELMLEKNQSD
jgi:hypothetical protein